MSTTDAEREAFEALLSTLPAPMQATIRDTMSRNESNSWTFWRGGFQAGRAQALAEMAARPAVAWMQRRTDWPAGKLEPFVGAQILPWASEGYALIVRPSHQNSAAGRDAMNCPTCGLPLIHGPAGYAGPQCMCAWRFQRVSPPAAAAEPLCMCKDRPLSKCPGEWEPGCDLGANEKHVRVGFDLMTLGKLGGRGMVVCPKCGNKRCPHANDGKNACTNSNESGQPGSAYP